MQLSGNKEVFTYRISRKGVAIMASLNVVVVCGNLTRDPELRFTPSGTPVCNFGLAVNEYKKDGKQDVNFFNCVAWNKAAELVNEHLNKGSGALIQGKLQQRSWEKEDGTKMNAVEIVAFNVQFLPKGQGNGKPAEKATEVDLNAPVEDVDLGDDIPF